MIAATVIGNIGRDAEMKQVSGQQVLSFSIASTRSGKGAEATTWVTCSLWGSRGEKLANLLKKGARVAVTGELSSRESTKNGKTYIELRVDQLELQGGGQRQQGSGSSKQQQSANQPSESEESNASSDDIPF